MRTARWGFGRLGYTPRPDHPDHGTVEQRSHDAAGEQSLRTRPSVLFAEITSATGNDQWCLTLQLTVSGVLLGSACPSERCDYQVVGTTVLGPPTRLSPPSMSR